MYTVKQAATLTGVPQATLRAWERRYGVVQPVRSGGGYRLYDEDQIATLRTMAQLVGQGVPASVAAEHAVNGPGPVESDPAGAAGDLVEAARSLDPRHLRQLVDQAFTTLPFEQVVETWLMPELVRLGEAWESGELTVAQEHFASAQLMRAIALVFEADEVTEGSGPVLVGLPSGARHEIGVFVFATCLRRLGVDVVYLGIDVPIAEWVAAASEQLARGVVVGVTMPEDGIGAQAIVDTCADLSPPLTVWVGGPRRGTVHGATVLPDDMTEAARIVQRSLAAGVA